MVECGVLEQKAHLLSDLSHLVESEAGNILSMDANRSRVRYLQADNDSEQNAFAGTASTQHGQGFSAAYGQGDSVQEFLASEGLTQVLHGNRRHAGLSPGFLSLHHGRNIDLIGGGHFLLKFLFDRHETLKGKIR